MSIKSVMPSSNYVGSLISFLTIGTVLATIDPVCLVIILAVVLTFLPLSRKVGALQMGRRKDNAALHRRSDYFQRIFYSNAVPWLTPTSQACRKSTEVGGSPSIH